MLDLLFIVNIAAIIAFAITGALAAFIIRALAITQNLTMPSHKGLH